MLKVQMAAPLIALVGANVAQAFSLHGSTKSNDQDDKKCERLRLAPFDVAVKATGSTHHHMSHVKFEDARAAALHQPSQAEPPVYCVVGIRQYENVLTATEEGATSALKRDLQANDLRSDLILVPARTLAERQDSCSRYKWASHFVKDAPRADCTVRFCSR